MLNPVDKEAFDSQGAYNLIRSTAYIAFHAARHEEALQSEIVFTGGFKASLPILTETAIWLGDYLSDVSGEICMSALFEEADRAVTVPLLANRSRPSALQAVMGFAAARDPAAHYPKYKQLDRFSKKKSVSSIEPKELRPLFCQFDGPGGPRLELSILGKTLQAVVEARLAQKETALDQDEELLYFSFR